MRWLCVLAVASLGCGSSRPCEREWREADERNERAEAPEGSCNVCGNKVCPEGTGGLWLARDETQGKRIPNERAECSVVWVEHDGVDAEVICTPVDEPIE